MHEIIVPQETKNEIFTMWQKHKNKTFLSKKVGLCRKKLTKIIHEYEHASYFDVKKEKNWLVND